MNSMKEKMVSPLATKPNNKGNVIKDENIFTEVFKGQIIDSIYRELGKPENIIKEKLALYLGRETPAGAYQPPWNDGGWQRGRLTVFVGYEEDGLQKQVVGDSWFFKTDGKILKVSDESGSKFDENRHDKWFVFSICEGE